jgi:hypothetical protein
MGVITLKDTLLGLSWIILNGQEDIRKKYLIIQYDSNCFSSDKTQLKFFFKYLFSEVQSRFKYVHKALQ